MFGSIYRVGLVVILAAACLCNPPHAMAQVSPTTTATVTGSVRTSTGAAVVGAQVSINGPKQAMTKTDAHGYFVFLGVPYGNYTISASATGLGTTTRQFVVTEDVNVAVQYEATGRLKTIASVSTRANARFNVTPASITHVDPLSHALNGETSWRKILEQIPGVSVGGQSNSNVIFSTLPDSPFIPVQISINGALPYETATLIDDMPLISSSFLGPAGSGTNIALYPLNGFSSADIVRGPGANAPSILNSIGGSFVLHAPGFAEQSHYDVSLTRDPYGGMLTTAAASLHFGRFSLVTSYGVNNSPGPLGNSFGVYPHIATTPLTVDGKTFKCTGSCAIQFNYVAGYQPDTGFSGYTTGLLLCCASTDSSWNQHAGSIALTYKPSAAVTAEIYYAGLADEIHYFGGAYSTDFVPPAGYTGGFPAGTSSNLIVGGAPYPHSPDRQASRLLEEKITAQVKRGIFRFEMLQNSAWNELSNTMSGAPTVVQLFGGGQYCNDPPTCSSMTPAVFDGESHSVTFSPVSILNRSVSNNRDVLLGYSTPLGTNARAGVSFVSSYYNTPSSFFVHRVVGSRTLNAIGSVPSGVSQTTNETRVFLGANPSAQTSLDLSWYFVRAMYHVQNPNNTNVYTDSSFNYNAPRLGFVWRPSTAVAIRASAGGGFAEAPLNDLIGTNSPFCDSFGCYVSPPNLSLSPETSFGFDLGTDIRLNRDTVGSLDVYRSNLYGQIYNFTSLSGTYLGQPLYVTTNGNLGKSRYEGILLDVRHTVPSGFLWSVGAGLTRGYLVSVPKGFYDDPSVPCTQCTNLAFVPNINFNGEFAGAIPYAQATASIGYQWKPHEYANLIATYYGNNNSYIRPAFVDLDSNIGFPITKDTSLLLTVRNITAVYDRAVTLISPDSVYGVPSVNGPPFGLTAGYFGPRSAILTLQFHP